LLGGAVFYEMLAYAMHSTHTTLAVSLAAALAVVFIVELIWIISHNTHTHDILKK
jgi:hypothetical protein